MKTMKLIRSYSDQEFQGIIKEWLYSFAQYIETKAEEEYGLERLKTFISKARVEAIIAKKLIDFTEDYLKTFQADLPVLCPRVSIIFYRLTQDPLTRIVSQKAITPR